MTELMKRYEAETGEKAVVVAGSRADVVKQIGNAVPHKYDPPGIALVDRSGADR